MMFRMMTRMIKNDSPNAPQKTMRFQPDKQDDAGMVKASKFKNTVNWDDDGMFSSMMSRMRTRKKRAHPSPQKKTKNGQHPTLQDDGGSCQDDDVSIVPIIPAPVPGHDGNDDNDDTHFNDNGDYDDNDDNSW